MTKLILTLGLAALLGLSACSRQQSDWEKTRAANTTDAYELFLKEYPSGEFTAQAQARLKELYEERDWHKARDLDLSDAYQEFLKQYPNGKWSEEARIRIENFTLASAPSNSPSNSPSAQTAASPPKSAPSAAAGVAAPAATAPAKKALKKPAAKSGDYAVQLGAFNSGADAAHRRWGQLTGKYPKLLRGLSPQVTERQESAGTIYRLQVENLSDKRARSICKKLKAHSQDCIVLKTPGRIDPG